MLSYFYGFSLEQISKMTTYQFVLYMSEISNIMRLFDGQPPAKRPAELQKIAAQYGMQGPR